MSQMVVASVTGVAEQAVEATEPAESRWLTRGVAGIGGASLLADLGHEVPTSLLPSFLTSTLRAPAAALGLIEGIADGCAGVARFAGGALADDPHRRRRSALGGYTATAVLSSLIGVTTSAWQVGVLRASAWSTRGLRVPARIGGPLLALGLVALVGTRTAILLSVIPGLLAAVAILYAIHVTRRPTERSRQPLRFHLRAVLHGQLGRIFLGISAFEIGNVAATLLILRATELLTPGHGHDNATKIALGLYIAYNAAAAIFSVPGGHLGDKKSNLGVLALGIGCFLGAYLGFAFVGTSIALMAAAFVAAGAAIAFVETAEHAVVAEHAPVPLRGSAFGALATAQALGNFAASALAGILWTEVSPRAAFIYLAAWMTVALVALVPTRRSSTAGSMPSSFE